MPRAFRTAPVAVVGLLLLAACGTQSPSREDARSQAGGDGPVRAEALCPSDHTQYGSLPTPADSPVTPSGTPTPLPLPSPAATDETGVRVTGLYAWAEGSGCAADYSAEFEVTNQGTEAVTYTVTVGFLSASGGAVDNVEKTVESVGPGRTAKAVVAMREPAVQAPEVAGVDVIKVRSAPVGELSSASGPCPASGVRVFADRGDAAMGLRVVGLHLVNCGTRPYRVYGYPELELLDEDRDTVDGVRILHGTDQIAATGLAGGGEPRPVVLRPGEAARASLAWRNTTGFGEAVNAPYARVRAKPGAEPVTVTPEFDLGTTGKLGVGPWERDETYRDPATGTPRP
ncbi:DUF4232 domain-containing protein [Streptomyces chartreusis]|uniref:DUF4232 domain-containing protein n=1 Tax=Streptomyces chartreusis TaxID=1969 RepID=UPI00371B63C5